MLSSAGGASAEQPEHEPTRGEVIAIAARFDAGVPTQADEAWAKRWPDIASAVPDGRRTEVGVTSQTVMLAATACHYADRYMIVKSGTGGKLYACHTVLNSWCENGTSISSNQFSDYFSDINGAPR